MYTAIRRYEGLSAGSVEEITRKVKEGFVPIIKGTPGFVGYYVVDSGGGTIASISVFQDKAGADESVRRAAEWVRQNLGSLVPNPPQVTTGEVVLAEEGHG
jgi:hypothetical protein